MENPRVLLLDEAFNALDVTTVKEAMRNFRDDGGAIVFTSHAPTDIPELADHTLTLSADTITAGVRDNR